MIRRMFNTIACGIPAGVLAMLTLGCGGDEPATPEQRKDIATAVDSAAAFLVGSKRYGSLADPEIPAVDSTADVYAASENELRLVADGIAATVRDDSAEVLFTMSVKKDSVTREDRDAFVRLARKDGKWIGSEAYVVEE